MSKSTIARHYTRLLSLWPKDPLRPNQPFTKTIEFRGAPFGVKPLAPTDASSTSKPAASAEVRDGAASVNTKAELANINALYSLLENRYSKRHPMSESVLKPVSNPEYYERLMAEIERAPTKSWLQAKLDMWKMKIRWQ